MSLNSKLSCFSANLTVVDLLVDSTRLGVDCTGLNALGSSSRSSSSLSIAGRDGKDGNARSSAAWIRLQTRDGVSNGIKVVVVLLPTLLPATSVMGRWDPIILISQVIFFINSRQSLTPWPDCCHPVLALSYLGHLNPSCCLHLRIQAISCFLWRSSKCKPHSILARACRLLSNQTRLLHRRYLQWWSPSSNVHDSKRPRTLQF